MKTDSLVEEASLVEPYGSTERKNKTKKKFKPVVKLLGGGHIGYLLAMEGLEGYHQGMSEMMSEKYKKPHAVYLNYGYFQVKPVFHAMKWKYTNEPDREKLKTRNIGGKNFRSGVFELKDVRTGQECIMWTFTTPESVMVWQGIKNHIEAIVDDAERYDITPDEDGYLPIIIRIAKNSAGASRVYAVVAGTTVDIPAETLADVGDSSIWKYYNEDISRVTEYEDGELPTIFQGMMVGDPDDEKV